jgi:hypothetical protein
MSRNFLVFARELKGEEPFYLEGHEARAFALLAQRHDLGVDLFDFPNGPGIHLASYITRLKDRGFDIHTLPGGEQDGLPARYFLNEDVSLMFTMEYWD